MSMDTVASILVVFVCLIIVCWFVDRLIFKGLKW